ncbi:hypothetical protein BJ322DRAFT_1205467 [Thelephora terrestris]|uniref:HNH domain-containing protein n=1 Tax=Thelephora terrestris TaxID=56493 RepID=A0A9P6HCM3_9AGAM|nr:hypothetical protein BJ322DRAFT_1205467 [Thelephora terrestris]
MSSKSSSQFSTFKDCLARRLISTTDLDGPEGSDDPLDEFTSYLASEVWPALPDTLYTASYESLSSDTVLQEMASDPFYISLDAIPIPTSFFDTLTSYTHFEDAHDCIRFLRKVLSDYLTEATAPPPVWKQTRGEKCEICERGWVRLTYHHLIPRSVHGKVLKRKWHTESMLNSVAWLCRPCHSAVHHVASNEDLARYFYTVDLLLERDDIQAWKKYASKQK